MFGTERDNYEAERAAFKAAVGMREQPYRACACTPGSPCGYHEATVVFVLPVRR